MLTLSLHSAQLAVTVQGRIAITLGYTTTDLVNELTTGSLGTNFAQNAFLRLDDFTAVAYVCKGHIQPLV
jgi:hypothetical protein